MSGREMETYVAGIKQTRKAITAGGAREVLLAENADPALTEPLQTLAQTHRIPVRWIPSMKELGQICRLSVGAAAAAVIAP